MARQLRRTFSNTAASSGILTARSSPASACSSRAVRSDITRLRAAMWPGPRLEEDSDQDRWAWWRDCAKDSSWLACRERGGGGGLLEREGQQWLACRVPQEGRGTVRARG